MEMDLDDLTVRYVPSQSGVMETACYPLTRCCCCLCLVDADSVALCRLHPPLLLSVDTKHARRCRLLEHRKSPLGFSSSHGRYIRRKLG